MTCSRAGARHDMRDAVPPCEMRYRGEAGTGRRNLSRRRPGRPRRPVRRPHPRRARRRLERAVTADPRAPTPSTTPRVTPGRRTRTPSQHPPDEEDPPEQTATTTFTLHAFKTTPEQHSRCVVLPDAAKKAAKRAKKGLNAPTGAWCSLTRKEPHGRGYRVRLNAPTGAWCSLTRR